MTEEQLVQATGLQRRFGPHLAVDGVSLELHRGEVLGLLGPNGAGKTTLLRMLTGCLAPSAGKVLIGGVALASQPLIARRQLGYLPEIPPLHRELSPREYLRFCARLHGLRGPALKQAVDEALAACGLEDVANQLIQSLSKGFQQRTGLAQAIVHKPALIVLDEPTVGLDPNQMQQIRRLIGELAQEHAIILSSHILSEVQAVCDRAIIMSGGRIVHETALRKDSQASLRLLVGMRKPPPPERLREFSGVATVEQVDSTRFRLLIEPGHDPRQALVLQSVALDWGLRELYEERPALEDLFSEVTA